MFTDMVGYTALGQKNEALSIAVVEEQKRIIRPILSKHNGREVKTIGDAFMVEFQSALDAARCAYDIQRTVREANMTLPAESKLHLRIGIHEGDVIGQGSDISGDAVNIASRIEPLAADGGVCLTRHVWESVGNRIDVPMMSLGPKPLKNVTEPMEVFVMAMPWEKEAPGQWGRLDNRRVAILPFANFSVDPSDAFFADGITEEIIATASNVSGLSIISRTSVMGYKGTAKKLKEIGRELEAGSVLEGSFRKAGNKIRVTAQLIDVNSDSHVWAQSYDRTFDDVFAIQSDIAMQVASVLRVKINPSEEARIKEVPTKNSEAHAIYLKGKVFLSREGDREAQLAAIGQFEKALELDPSYALAYCGMSAAYHGLAFHEYADSKDALEKAGRSARKALELDELLAEAHVEQARNLAMAMYDVNGAIQELKRAVELDPNLAEAYAGMANGYNWMLRWDESLGAVEQMLRLDPFSVAAARDAGTLYLYSGRYDLAVRHLTRALELDPGNTFCLDNLGLAHIKKGLVDLGVDEIERAFRLAGQPPGWSGSADLAYAYAKAGREQDARGVLDNLLSIGKKEHMPAAMVAGAYAVIGDKENALDWLGRAYEEGSPYILSMRSDIVFENLREEPRFKELARKMGLDEYPAAGSKRGSRGAE